MIMQKGQTTIEYSVLIIVLLGALLTTSVYIKRGIQGRWKAAVDDLGDQYDPLYASGQKTQSLDSIEKTKVLTTQFPNGLITVRHDSSFVNETVTGVLKIEAQQAR